MKKKKISLIDYGMGNLTSLCNAFNYLNTEVSILSEADKIEKSDILILPGVGSFKKAMFEIKKKYIDQAIYNTIKKGNYIFGICLGMQLLASSSEEEKPTNGLSIIKNKVKRFSLKETKNKQIPHVGFNEVHFEQNNRLFKGLKNNSEFYFVHSFYPELENESISIMKTKYGKFNFTSK